MGCKVIEGQTQVGECVIGVKLGKVNIVSENRETATAAQLAAAPDTTAHTLVPRLRPPPPARRVLCNFVMWSFKQRASSENKEE